VPFRIQGGNKKDEEDDTNSDETEDDDVESDLGYSPSSRKNSKRPAFDHEGSMSFIGDKEIDNLYNMPLETLLEDEPFSFGFKRRRAGKLDDSQNLTSLSEETNSSNLTDAQKIHSLKRGFMGFYNPRFDKTAFLDNKQALLTTVCILQAIVYTLAM